jgi:putative copper export protein
VTTIRWLHLVAMAFFVGGQLMLGLVVVPAMRGGDRERLRAIARGFGVGTLMALTVLAVTGIGMASHFHDWSSSVLHVKLALVGLVVVLIAAHLRRPEWRVLDGAVLVASLAIVWLGVDLAH